MFIPSIIGSQPTKKKGFEGTRIVFLQTPDCSKNIGPKNIP